MNLKLIVFIVILTVFVLTGVSSFVRNFHGLLKKNNPTIKEVSYVEGIACLTVVLFMVWIILVQISLN